MIFLLYLLLSVCPVAYGMKGFSLNTDEPTSVRVKALVNAAFYGNAEYVQKMCGAGVSVHGPDGFGYQPLQAAIAGVRFYSEAWQVALARQMKVAKILLSHGADFELKTNSSGGNTVFHECLACDLSFQAERPRKLILGLIIFEELLKKIFATQGPIAKAFLCNRGRE